MLNIFVVVYKYFSLQKPPIVPICTECLGTESCNPAGEAEALVSCAGCGQSVHPSCRVYRYGTLYFVKLSNFFCVYKNI